MICTKEKRLLFSGLSEQKRKYLKHAIESAENGSFDELKNAVALAAPIKAEILSTAMPEPKRIECGGRRIIELAALINTPGCDGIIITADYDSTPEDVFLTVGVGTDMGMGGYIKDIPLPLSGSSMYLSFDLFTPLPNGCDRIMAAIDSEDEDISVTLTFKGVFTETVEEDTRTAYAEIPAETLCNDRYYKIVDMASNRALAILPKISETKLRWEQSLIRTQDDQRVELTHREKDYTQSWQLYKGEWGSWRIINKGNSNHLGINAEGKLYIDMCDLNNPEQDFTVQPAGRGKFSITGQGGVPLKCDNAKSGIWQVYECVCDEWVQTFADEFNGTELNKNLWGVYNAKIRPATEPVYFLDRSENYHVADGNLVITSLADGYNGIPQTAAYMDTRGTYGIVYGKMEMSARVATGSSIWPAFWSMGIVGNWPYQGEIDVMELVGGGENNELDSGLFGTLHYATEISNHMEKGHFFLYRNREDLNLRYHTYAAQWEYDHLRLYIDDMQYMSLYLNSDGKKWGFGDNPHYLILNTSVRGPGEDRAFPETAKESNYYIDWVRCYKRAGQITPCDDLSASFKTPDVAVADTNEWHNCTVTSSDGKYAATVGQGSCLLIYDQNTCALIKKTELGFISEAMAFSPDNSKLCVGSRNGGMLIFDCSDFDAASIRISNPGTFQEIVRFTPDGKYILSGGRDANEEWVSREKLLDSRYIRMWDINGELKAETATGSDVRNIAVSPDGSKVAAALSDGKVKIYSLPDLLLIDEHDAHGDVAVRGLMYSPSGKSLLSSDEAGEIIIYTDKAFKKLNNVNPSSVRRVRYSPDGRLILAVCADNCARLFDAVTGKTVSLLGGFKEMIKQARFSPNGDKIAVASFDGSIKIFSGNGEYIKTLKTNNPKGTWVMDIAFSADGKRLFAGMGVLNCDYCMWKL